MIPDLRRAYNAAYTDEKYRAYQRRLAAEAGCEIPFRLAETPVFLPPGLRDAMVEATLALFAQLAKPANLLRSLDAVPAEFDVPDCDPLPLFAQADFAVARERGRIVPRLIELQAFPSLYAFQLYQTRALCDMTPDSGRLQFLLSGLDGEGYRRAVGDAILDGLPPQHVVLMDIDPPTQKTYPDFTMSEQLWGIPSVSPTEVEKHGKELWYRRKGKPTRILRIYNRVIFDELAAKGLELPFDFREPLDVAWAGHPNWYFRWSKHCLPVLRHETVPEAHLLSDFDRAPTDLEDWVLKPLFSFAGSGVKVDVTPADLRQIPAAQRSQWLLMRKVEYAPVIETTERTLSKVEVRVMCVWMEGRPVPVTTLARLSQGRMMGVAFNKDRTWVGSSGCLWPKD
jgi:hypothetical protein